MDICPPVALTDGADYPHRDERKVLYINSSGVCNLNCKYCFTNPNKRPVSMTCEDFDFLYDSLGGNMLLIFSGQGDFFSGYRRSQRFLEHILQKDVRVYLDFNASLVQEMLELDEELLAKVLVFDVSYHYETMQDLGLLDKWANNVIGLAEKVQAERIKVKTILAKDQMEQWGEKFAFYAETVYPATGIKLQAVLDGFCEVIRTKPMVKLVNSLVAKFPDAVFQSKFTTEQKTEPARYLAKKDDVISCPAGSRYFKVQVNGDIVPCNRLLDEYGFSMGNTKQRRLLIAPDTIQCDQRCGPSCLANWDRNYPA